MGIIRTRRIVGRELAIALASALAAAGLVVGSVATAHADADDERFVDAVNALGIPSESTTNVPEVGHHICEMLTSGLEGNANPVPVVRGVVTTLTGNGISRSQAVGLMRVASAVYCPEWSRYMGR